MSVVSIPDAAAATAESITLLIERPETEQRG
jgi:hypothetical protein